MKHWKKVGKKILKKNIEKLVKYIDFKTDSTARFSHVTVAYCPFFYWWPLVNYTLTFDVPNKKDI